MEMPSMWRYKMHLYFQGKLQDFKPNEEQHRANSKTDMNENLGYPLASDVDSAGESFLWVVL